MQEALARIGAKEYHERRITEAMQLARRAGGAGTPPEDAGARPAQPAWRAPPPPVALLSQRAASVASAKPASTRGSRSGSQSRGSRSGSLLRGAYSRRAASVKRVSEVAPVSSQSVREWLDEVKSGFAGKFASAFEEVAVRLELTRSLKLSRACLSPA